MSSEHKPLSAEEIEKLRELEAKATKGDWKTWGFDGVVRTVGAGEPDSHVQIMEVPGYMLRDIPVSELEANAALIAAMRNALPRLLAMLTPPADKTGSKGLVDGIKAISDEFGHNFTWMSKEHMAPISKPPADAEVREAVGLLELNRAVIHFALQEPLDTILSFVRAAQAPHRVERERPKVAEEALGALWEIAPNWSRKLEKYIGGLESDIDALRAQVEELKAENDDIRSATMDYTHEIDKLTDRATRAEAELAETRVVIAGLIVERDKYQRER